MDARTLRGRSAEAFALLGKPCVGARYTGRGDARRLEDGARCVLCGRPATNAHHHPPKGMGGGTFPLSTPRGEFRLRPPLFAVCGSGNASGCHRLLHSGRARIRWEWDADGSREAWLSGELPAAMRPNDERLFAFGRYEIESPYGRKEVRDDREGA